MNKPIIPGCRAIIINSGAGNDGKIVNVVEKVEAFKDNCDLIDPTPYRWEIDCWLKCTSGDDINHVGEYQLKRIDDYDGNDKISWEDMKDIWQPTKETV